MVGEEERARCEDRREVRLVSAKVSIEVGVRIVTGEKGAELVKWMVAFVSWW